MRLLSLLFLSLQETMSRSLEELQGTFIDYSKDIEKS
jgi:hypothetical protein